MKKVLCLLAHPNLATSRANRLLHNCFKELDFVTVHSLYETYPEYFVNVPAEQARLREHDILLVQHPLYWYSMPPLLKIWLDQVLEFNFAYGPEGHALRGKDFLLSLTTGGSADSYRPDGYHGHSIHEFFPPYRQTAQLCGMRWHDPAVLHEAPNRSEEEILAHGHQLATRLTRLARKEA